MGSSTTRFCDRPLWCQGMRMTSSIACRCCCICSRYTASMHGISAAPCTSVCITSNVVCMTSGTSCCCGVSCKSMRVGGHLICSKCYHRRTTCFSTVLKFPSPVLIPTGTLPAPTPPKFLQKLARICINHTHINTSNRIDCFRKLLDIILKKFSINPHIPVF